MPTNGDWKKIIAGMLFTGAMAWLSTVHAEISDIKKTINAEIIERREKVATLEEVNRSINFRLEKIDKALDKVADHLDHKAYKPY